jgi:hypothetical protein
LFVLTPFRRRKKLARMSAVDAVFGMQRPFVRLLGASLVCLRDGGEMALVAERRHQLLAYLACCQRWVNRDEVAAMLWGEREQRAARSNLRNVVMQVRREAIDGFESRTDMLRWSIESDAQTFEAAVTCRDWQGAIAAYGGPLPDTLEVGAPAAFADWQGDARPEGPQRRARKVIRYTDRHQGRRDGPKQIERMDRLENMRAQMLKQAASRAAMLPATARDHRDGATQAIYSGSSTRSAAAPSKKCTRIQAAASGWDSLLPAKSPWRREATSKHALAMAKRCLPSACLGTLTCMSCRRARTRVGAFGRPRQCKHLMSTFLRKPRLRA